MTSPRDYLDKERLSLLKDDEFVTLIEAQYAKNGKPVDDVAKNQVWRELETKINRDTKKAFRTWLPLASATVLILALMPLLLMEKNQSDSRVKGEGVVSPPIISLAAYAINASGELTASTGEHKFGSTVVFKVDTYQKLAIALALAKNEENVAVRFVSQTLQPGDGQILQQNDKTYGYMVEPNDEDLRFCVLAAENTTALKERIRILESIWHTLPAQSCTRIHVSH